METTSIHVVYEKEKLAEKTGVVEIAEIAEIAESTSTATHTKPHEAKQGEEKSITEVEKSLTEVETETAEDYPLPLDGEEDSSSEGISAIDLGIIPPDFLDALRRLGLVSVPKPAPPPIDQRVLPAPTLDAVADAIKTGKCKNIIVMTGAGMSCAAGIPDFRTPGTGLYDNLQKYNLPTPESIFSLDFFRHTPEPFFSLAKELYPGSYKVCSICLDPNLTRKPTHAHYFIRLLHEKGLLLRNYSQNIDTLERLAGIPAEKVIEAHGSFSCAHCLECKKEYTPAEIKDVWTFTDPILTQQTIFDSRIPRCDSCCGLIKPDIVFFGEGLPDLFFRQQQVDFPECDLLLIMGTSLQVYPFAGLITKVSCDTPRVLINMTRAGDFERDPEYNYRDILALGDLQETTWKFVKLLEWEADFTALLEREKAR